MAFAPTSKLTTESGSGVFPSLVLVQGEEQRLIPLKHSPFNVGRKVDKDLVIADPRVSRDHAKIVSEDGVFFLIDEGSKHGTFVNGQRVQRQKLERNDRLEFGVRDGAYVVFHPQHPTSNTAREFLSQISGLQISTDTTDLEKLTMFLEAARKLNTTGVLDEILVTLVETTLKLTRAERGYVFLKSEEGALRLAAGRNSKGEPLLDDKTISHSILEEAVNSASEYLVTDTSQSLDLAARRSIMAYDLRTVICIPLRKPQIQTRGEPVTTEDYFAVAVADVCGKGVSAALLANTLQGMIYSHLVARMPLAEIVAAVNLFFTQKHLGEKYATVVIARITPDGELEYVNCGHVPPLLISNHQVTRPEKGNLPVGLLAEATYESGACRLQPGDRLLIVTDGVTEAENARGDFFENERLEKVASTSSSYEDILNSVANFCGGTPLTDDCTVVELVYTG